MNVQPMLVHVRHVSVEWGDCDPAGIVFYPRFFAYFDASTAALFARASGMKKPELLEHYGVVGFPMVDTRARFLVPCAYGDEVTIESRVTRFGRTSFDVEHRLLKDHALCVECTETRVWVARAASHATAIKPVPIPEELMERFGVDVPRALNRRR